jgi:hypothetical protein
MAEEQDIMRWKLEKAARAGAQASFQYLDSLRKVTPLAVSDELLTAIDEDGGCVRRFRLAFVREVFVREEVLASETADATEE